MLHTVDLDVNGLDGELETFQLLGLRLFLTRFQKVLEGEDLAALFGLDMAEVEEAPMVEAARTPKRVGRARRAKPRYPC